MAAIYTDFHSLLITERGSVLPSVLMPQNLLSNLLRLSIKGAQFDNLYHKTFWNSEFAYSMTGYSAVSPWGLSV